MRPLAAIESAAPITTHPLSPDYDDSTERQIAAAYERIMDDDHLLAAAVDGDDRFSDAQWQISLEILKSRQPTREQQSALRAAFIAAVQRAAEHEING